MNLNYLAFFLISFVPLIIGYLWYRPESCSSKWSGVITTDLKTLSVKQILLCLVMSVGLVYGYMNLIIHQLGFYELFFTDIIKGSSEAQDIVDQFMSQHGEKHRHFGHGVLHGVINALLFAFPFIIFQATLESKGVKFVCHHLMYWVVTSAVIGGLISAYV